MTEQQFQRAQELMDRLFFIDKAISESKYGVTISFLACQSGNAIYGKYKPITAYLTGEEQRWLDKGMDALTSAFIDALKAEREKIVDELERL